MPAKLKYSSNLKVYLFFFIIFEIRRSLLGNIFFFVFTFKLRLSFVEIEILLNNGFF